MTAPYVVIILLEVALIIKLGGLWWGRYKENKWWYEKQLELLIENERLNETIWDLTEGRGY